MAYLIPHNPRGTPRRVATPIGKIDLGAAGRAALSGEIVVARSRSLC